MRHRLKIKHHGAKSRQSLSISAAEQRTLLGAFSAQITRLQLLPKSAEYLTGFSQYAFYSWRNNLRRMRKRNARIIRIATLVLFRVKRHHPDYIDLKYTVTEAVKTYKD